MKTVWGQPHKGSNPFLSAIYIYTFKDTAIGVLKAVNKIIYHTAEQVQLLRRDNIQFDTVALLLLTLTHPRRITAIQLRMVSALSSLADIQQIQTMLYPIPENRLSSQSLVITKLAIQFVLPLVKWQVGIYTADLRLVYQIEKTRVSSR